MRVGSLFAGIGGFDLGFERAGMSTVWQVEKDAYRRTVLAKHFPQAQRFQDVQDVGLHNLAEVDLICGGFPCHSAETMTDALIMRGDMRPTATTLPPEQWPYRLDGSPMPGSLNPTWVEWLMGFPLGWTDLERSETPSSHK